jgi:hypothetical protein
MDGLFFINWSGQNTSGMERMVMYTAAVKLLQASNKSDKVYFTHPILEGVLTAKGAGFIGSIRGNVFRADLDEVDGIPRAVEFLVRFGSELHADEDVTGFSYDFGSPETNYAPVIEQVTPDNDTEVHALN